MTPDQYRREGAEAMRAYIANDCDPAHLSRSDNPTEFRAIDVDEVLAGTSVQKTHKTEIGTAAPDAVEAEKDQTARRLVSMFMLDCNAIGYVAAAENLVRGIKNHIALAACKEARDD